MKKYFVIVIVGLVMLLCSCGPKDFNGYGELLYKSQTNGVKYVTFTDGKITRTFQLYGKGDYESLQIGEVYNFSYGVRAGKQSVWDIAETGQSRLSNISTNGID